MAQPPHAAIYSVGRIAINEISGQSHQFRITNQYKGGGEIAKKGKQRGRHQPG